MVSITKFLFLKIFNKISQQLENIKEINDLKLLFPEMNENSFLNKKLKNLLDFL